MAGCSPRVVAVALIALAASAGLTCLVCRHLTPGAARSHPARFRDVASEAGLTFHMNYLPLEQGEQFKGNLYDHGCGLAIGDYDGDGLEDIYFLNQLGPNALFQNQGNDHFVEVTRRAGVGLGDRVCAAATWADYDNDGRQDLFVTSTRGGNVLFHNLGAGEFEEVTKRAGVEHVGHSQTAVFFDYDNDGFLDLLVTNTAAWTATSFDPTYHYYPGPADFWDLGSCPPEYNILYHNNGNGTFTDVTEESGLKGHGWAGDVAVFDYDADGHLDLLIANMFGRSRLYRNEGNGRFEDVTAATLKRTSWGATGCKVFDFNNDGKLDLYLVDMHSDMWMAPGDPGMVAMIKERVRYPAAAGMLAELQVHRGRNGRLVTSEHALAETFHIRYDEVVFGNSFFKNLGRGHFREMAGPARLETWWPWGIATGDFDNNGCEDVFLASGMGFPYCYWPNSLLMNTGNETFTDRAKELGIEPPARGYFLEQKIGSKEAPRSSRCCAVADFDGDGRLEIVTNNFNDRPYFFKNDLPRKNYLACRLKGTKSNRDAIGAVVRLHAGTQILTRQVQPAGGYLAQSSRTLHFGLADRANVERMEIRWPSGKVQVVFHPAVNQLHDIMEAD